MRSPNGGSKLRQCRPVRFGLLRPELGPTTGCPPHTMRASCGGLVGRFRSLGCEDLAYYRCLRLPARSHPWASTHRDVTFNLTTPSWTSATADGGRYSLDDKRPRDTVSRVSPELTTVPSRVSSLSWTSHPRAMSANRNVRRGGPSRPPTIGERADALLLRSGPYDIGVTRARGLDRGRRVIGQSQIPGRL